MTRDQLEQMFINEETDQLEWEGKCHDCGREVCVVASVDSDNRISVIGGAIYRTELVREDGTSKDFLKCVECFEKNRMLSNFRPCEVYSRVVGYLRPISQWNDGKVAEFGNRKVFNIDEKDNF